MSVVARERQPSTTGPLGALGVALTIVGLIAWPLLGDWRLAVTGFALLFPLAATGNAIHGRIGPPAPMAAVAMAAGALWWTWTGDWRAGVLGLGLALLLATVGAHHDLQRRGAD